VIEKNQIVKMVSVILPKGSPFDFKESDLIEYEEYWFINSKGQICSEIMGKSERIDMFRKLSNNYYASKEAGQVKLKGFLGDYYSKFNA